MADGEAGHGQVGMFLAAGKDLNIGIFSWSSSLCGRSQRAVLFRAMHVFMMRLVPQPVKKALLQGVPPSADGGIK